MTFFGMVHSLTKLLDNVSGHLAMKFVVRNA